MTIIKAASQVGPVSPSPLQQRGTKDAAPPLGDIAEPFYFDSRGLVGVTLLISNRIPAPSFFFFLFHHVIGDPRRQKTRGFPDPGEIKIRTGCLLFRASARNCPEFCSLRSPRTGAGGGECFPLRRGWLWEKRFGIEIVETRAQFQTDSQFSWQICRLTEFVLFIFASYFVVDSIDRFRGTMGNYEQSGFIDCFEARGYHF